MKIDEELIRKIAQNARLKLKDEEVKEFLPQLNDILEYFEVLKNAEATGSPSFHPVEIKDVFREDVVEESLTQEQALQNAENKKDGYFKGPKVV
jgi:aspartyl-tRNA(Asn)/glutamyl-tRNA(Gln) amidotransferase subunit C